MLTVKLLEVCFSLFRRVYYSSFIESVTKYCCELGEIFVILAALFSFSFGLAFEEKVVDADCIECFSALEIQQ